MLLKEKTFNERLQESRKVLKSHEGRVPIVVDKRETSQAPCLDKHKYLVPKDLTVGQFQYVIRKRLRLHPKQSIFMFANNAIIIQTQIVSQLYESNKSNDGFLYIFYDIENTFGKETPSNRSRCETATSASHTRSEAEST